MPVRRPHPEQLHQRRVVIPLKLKLVLLLLWEKQGLWKAVVLVGLDRHLYYHHHRRRRRRRPTTTAATTTLHPFLPSITIIIA